MAATIALIVVGTVWPNQSGTYVSDSATLMGSTSSPKDASARCCSRSAVAIAGAYSSLANKGIYRIEFVRDLNGDYGGLDPHKSPAVTMLSPCASPEMRHSANQHAMGFGGRAFEDSGDLAVVRQDGRWR